MDQPRSKLFWTLLTATVTVVSLALWSMFENSGEKALPANNSSGSSQFSRSRFNFISPLSDPKLEKYGIVLERYSLSTDYHSLLKKDPPEVSYNLNEWTANLRFKESRYLKSGYENICSFVKSTLSSKYDGGPLIKSTYDITILAIGYTNAADATKDREALLKNFDRSGDQFSIIDLRQLCDSNAFEMNEHPAWELTGDIECIESHPGQSAQTIKLTGN
jgi:hypothetical protein